MAKVIGIPIEDFDRSQLDDMTDVQLNELFLENSNCISYDYIGDFFDDLNNDMVDTENNWWKLVNID